MAYMIIIYLLLSIGVGQTTQQQRNYQETYLQSSTIVDAHLVANDPRFPASHTIRNNHNSRRKEK